MVIPVQQGAKSPTPPSEVNAILRPEVIERILAGMTEQLQLPEGLQVFTWEMTTNPHVPKIAGLESVLEGYGIEGYFVPQVSITPPIPTNPCETRYYVQWDWSTGLSAGKTTVCT
jgi:hypothetical protein